MALLGGLCLLPGTSTGASTCQVLYRISLRPLSCVLAHEGPTCTRLILLPPLSDYSCCLTTSVHWLLEVLKGPGFL